MKRLALLVFVSAICGCKTPGSMAELRDSGSDTVAQPALQAAAARVAVTKALRYLYDTQIKAPDTLGNNVRLRGEWPSYVRGSVADDSRLHALYDSNAFVPMFVSYPLSLLDDAALENDQQKLKEMRERTLALLQHWYLKPNGEMNFWPTVDAFHGPQQIAAALPFTRTLGPIFDIANDADDTAAYYVMALKSGVSGVSKDFPNIFVPWVDKNRVRKDDRESSWKPEGTGAYMTWLTDEDKPHNKQPVAFALANNVDCLVLGNVLYAIGLNAKINGGDASPPGQAESCALARDVIEKKSYPNCALYYPPQWLFPYAISRAFRDGGTECLAPSMGSLTTSILAAQAADGSWNDTGSYANLPNDVNSQEKEFRGDARSYSTALNLITLLNVGASHWPDRDATGAAIEKGISFLLSNIVTEDGKEFWQGGVFFSSSYQAIARWKSRPYTTAVVLEAMIKYLRRYGETDLGAWKLAASDVPAEWLVGGGQP